MLAGLLKFFIYALDHNRLATLQRQKAKSGRSDQAEIHQQVLKRKQVRRNLLANRHLLNAANIAHLPVAFWALGMSVVASDASRAHYDWRDQRTRSVVSGLRRDAWFSWCQSAARAFKIVEDVERSVHKWIIRNEAISDIVLLLADDATELKRKRRWDRDRARDGLVIVRHLS